MTTNEPAAFDIAADLVSAYLAGEPLVDVADPIAGDPELLGTVMVQLAVIAGEALKLSVDGTAADAEQLLRRITAVRDQ